MPLMTCPDCGKEISDAAITCPKCGLPRPQLELMSRERRAAEDEAAAERNRTIQYLYIGAAGCALVSLTLLIVMLVTGWSSVALGTKLKEFLVGAALGGIAYFLYLRAQEMRGTK